MNDIDSIYRYASLIESLIGASDPAAYISDRRPVYHPLRICCELTCERADSNLIPQIDRLNDHPMSALALHRGGVYFDRSDWIERASRIYSQLIDRQQPSGEFFPPDLTANLESRWYEELILLHAAAGYAAHVPGRSIDRAVARSAGYHLNEIQPDHATAEPWGLLAFIRFAPTMADQLLHNLMMQYPAGITGIPLLLLADVRYGLGQSPVENGRPNDDQPSG